MKSDTLKYEDDGLVFLETGSWAEEKYRLLSYYLSLFSTGMKTKWHKRVYIDLFSGPGCVRIKRSRNNLRGSPLLALSVRDPFDNYIFCEKDPESMETLRKRVESFHPDADVSYVHGDCNQKIDEILSHIPKHSTSQRVLSFCFVDPPDIGIHFRTIRALASANSVDFLILFALGMDVKRNIPNYMKKTSNKIDLFIGAYDWREEWAESRKSDNNLPRFLINQFERQILSLDYQKSSKVNTKQIRIPVKNVYLYHLAFYSRNQRGLEFWDKSLRGSSNQEVLEFSE
jgi:three-Cys-motif partner protein